MTNVIKLPVCSCKNTGVKAVKRKSIGLHIVDYVLCPFCKDWEAYYRTLEKMKDKDKRAEVIKLFAQDQE